MARSREHVIETESRRIVANHFPAERWVERDQTERDYGIDMTIEHFAGSEPSGRLLLLQIKGTDDPVPDDKALPFDMAVKSLKRCERFATPILLMWVPVQDERRRVWFLWLQSYIRIVLDHENPDWRGQKYVRLHMPIDNELGEATEGKLIHIAGEPARAAAFGQLSRLAHEARWAADDPRRLAPIFEEALLLEPIFADESWQWGQDQRHMIEKGLLACQVAITGRDPTDSDLREIGWTVNDQSKGSEERWRMLAAGAAHCAELMSTAVAMYYDDRLRHTTWNAIGDHDF